MPAAPAVLDSHALLAYFRNEPGGEFVERLLVRAAAAGHPLHMTEVNHAEVKYTLIRVVAQFPCWLLPVGFCLWGTLEN